jgi:hypothetical protein
MERNEMVPVRAECGTCNGTRRIKMEVLHRGRRLRFNEPCGDCTDGTQIIHVPAWVATRTGAKRIEQGAA